jgi:hypothetical protein
MLVRQRWEPPLPLAPRALLPPQALHCLQLPWLRVLLASRSQELVATASSRVREPELPAPWRTR